ncbi:MAG: N-acetylglucosaminyl-diphospho-decaprenol L-rhamnosyltransferase [Frankiaceae bacterium]|nr:N-acetylglucosaminyl-diphospho-decaprenol L-rhamnosyltransferase [Frankiaceae bacterium]
MSAEALRVVVVTYWPGDALRAFLDSLDVATVRETQVVLADNGSGDGVTEAAAETRPNVTLVRTGGNLGYGCAANVGASAGAPEGEWLVVANPDITWHAGSLDELLKATERWPQAAAFGPAILTPQGDLYPSARGFPSLGRGIGHALFGWWWPRNPWTRAYRREAGGPTEAPAGWLSGSCLLLRRSAYDAVGGFDPAYFMYFEDLDLARRLADAGWQSVYVPSAVVEHTGAHSTRRSRRAMLRAHHASAYRYLAGQYRGPLWLPVRLVLRLGLAARYLTSLVVAGVGEGAKPTRSGAVLDRRA